MKIVKIAVAVLALSASFLVGKVWANGVQTPRRDPTSITTPPDKQVLSGENIGIRVIVGSPDQNHLVQGSLVAKINGQWVEVVLSPKTIGSAK